MCSGFIICRSNIRTSEPNEENRENRGKTPRKNDKTNSYIKVREIREIFENSIEEIRKTFCKVTKFGAEFVFRTKTKNEAYHLTITDERGESRGSDNTRHFVGMIGGIRMGMERDRGIGWGEQGGVKGI
jgi:hypothetical protein